VETSYEGVAIRAAGNVHRHVAEKLFQVLPRGSVVLDIAAGNGALALRLQNCGYRVICVDGNPAKFEVGGIQCTEVDLNRDFAAQIAATGGAAQFSAIVAVEVIEHLENPAAFLRGCARLLAPDGVAIVTSPNLESAASRVRFATRGIPSWFSPEEAVNEHHVSPQFSWFMRVHAANASLSVAEEWCTSPEIGTTWADGWKTRLLYSKPVLRFLEHRWGASGGDVRLWLLRPGAGTDTRVAPARYWSSSEPTQDEPAGHGDTDPPDRHRSEPRRPEPAGEAGPSR